ncbi:MAG: hypothetical protein AB1641_18980 [Thermodesulfobacteriota bacterium]
MVKQLGGPNHVVRAYGSEQTRRAAWREEMIAQMLEKVRETSPVLLQTASNRASGPPPKGSIVDVFV